MKKLGISAVLTLAAVALFATTAFSRDSAPAAPAHAHAAEAGTAQTKLAVTLSTLLGEHVSLATQATQAGLRGGKEFPALAKALDRNSVAVANLIGYVEAFSRFLAGATGLPSMTLKAGITQHVLQLKGQLDAYAKGDYAKTYALTRKAHHHMVMTGETLANAIAKKFPQKFGS
jgi:hypothetical protein